MLKPLGTRVVIEPKEAETMTAGGLYIPDNAKEKPQQGVIVAVGPGSKENHPAIRGGRPVFLNHDGHILCKYSKIEAIGKFVFLSRNI